MAGYCTQCGGTGTRGPHLKRTPCDHCGGNGYRKGRPPRARSSRRKEARPVPLPGLRAARVAAGDTQETAGHLIGATKAHYGKYELGRVPLDLTSAALLARRYGVAIESLFGPDGPPLL